MQNFFTISEKWFECCSPFHNIWMIRRRWIVADGLLNRSLEHRIFNVFKYLEDTLVSTLLITEYWDQCRLSGTIIAEKIENQGNRHFFSIIID
jgi:hypothetical protein